MERIGQIAGELSGVSSELETRSSSLVKRQQKESVRQVSILLAQMSAGFPHQEFGTDTAEVYQLAFGDIALEFGLPALQQSLRSFLSRQKFFPHPSEVREDLEAMAKAKQVEAQKKLPALGCDGCADSPIKGYFMDMRDGERCFLSCRCRLARERAKLGIAQSQGVDVKVRAAGGAQ